MSSWRPSKKVLKIQLRMIPMESSISVRYAEDQQQETKDRNTAPETTREDLRKRKDMKYYPQKTPKETIEKINDIIRGEVVCDIGCSEGEWMVEMSRYAKKVIGIDIDVESLGIAAAKGLEVYLTDALFGGLPDADVYYMAMNHSAMVKIYRKLKEIKGKTIIIGINGCENSFQNEIKEGKEVYVGKFKNDAMWAIKDYQIREDFIDFSIIIINT
jgi:hypothetical protein